MVTWLMISSGHVTYFLETRSRCSTKMWRTSVTDGDIREIPKATNRKSGVADRMVTWPMISSGYVIYFLKTRSRYGTKLWRISVTDGGRQRSDEAYYFLVCDRGKLTEKCGITWISETVAHGRHCWQLCPDSMCMRRNGHNTTSGIKSDHAVRSGMPENLYVYEIVAENAIVRALLGLFALRMRGRGRILLPVSDMTSPFDPAWSRTYIATKFWLKTQF